MPKTEGKRSEEREKERRNTTNLHNAIYSVNTQLCISTMILYTVCPTRYRTRHFFNNFTTNEDIATKSEADFPHCVRNVIS